MNRGRRFLCGALVAVTATTTGCARGDRPVLTEPTPAPTGSVPTTVTVPTTTASTSTTTAGPAHPPSPTGRVYPAVSSDPAEAAARLYEIEDLIHTVDVTEIGGRAWADLAHEQQMHYRVIGRDPEWIRTTVAGASGAYAGVIERHLAARQAIGDIGHGGEPPVDVPAWEIIEPLGADELRSLYEAPEAATGIPWSFLAAINLIETGFGRIDGLSTAGAQGPMQFLPTTWEEVSDGDIDDPRDAIPAAARRTGGHPAKRTFQALRIEVNAELSVLTEALPAALDELVVGGRIAVLSYQSLEDRIVKQALAAVSRSTAPVGLPVVPADAEPRFELLTRGAEKPDAAEVAENPRAASARLRAAVRLREAA